MAGDLHDIGTLEIGDASVQGRRQVIFVPVSSEVAKYLDELALKGLWGVTANEVAQRMIEHCTRALIGDGTLKMPYSSERRPLAKRE